MSELKSNKESNSNRVLLYLIEALTASSEFMTKELLENEIMAFVSPLIGEYICKTEDGSADIDNFDQVVLTDKVIFFALMRLLRKILTKLGRQSEITIIKYKCLATQNNCLITRDFTLQHHFKDTMNIASQIDKICAIVKVMSNLSQEDIRFSFIENDYPAILSDLTMFVQQVLLGTIEKYSIEKRAINSADKSKFIEAINSIVWIVFMYCQYIINNHSANNRPGRVYNYTKRVLNILCLFLYSQSDFVKRTVAIAISSVSESNLSLFANSNKNEENCNSESIKLDEATHLASQLYRIDLDEFMHRARLDNDSINKSSDVEMSDNNYQNDGGETDHKETYISTDSRAKGIKIYDTTLDLIEFLKDEIMNKCDKDIFSVDLVLYLFTRCINMYGKYSSVLKIPDSDLRISRCLVEIINQHIISSSDCDLSIKSKKSISTYILIELINSLTSCRDRKSHLIKTKPDENSSKVTTNTLPKGRMKTRMIFSLICSLHSEKAGKHDNMLMKFLCEKIETFILYFLEGKGPITFSSPFEKSIIWQDNQDNENLLKVHDTEGLWRWNHILPNANCFGSRNFVVYVFNSCLELCGNLLYFSSLLNSVASQKYQQRHLSQSNSSSENSIKLANLIKLQSKYAVSDIHQAYIESSIKLKNDYSKALLCLRADKIQTNFMMILNLLCKNSNDFNMLQHFSAYSYYFKELQKISELSEEFKRPLPFDKLFNVINLLSVLWSQYANKQPSIWKAYVIENQDVLKMLFKTALRIPEQGSHLCLLLLSAAFEMKTDKKQLEATPINNSNSSIDLQIEQNITSNCGNKLEDIIMEDEETKLKSQQLTTQFVGFTDMLFNHFVIGNSKKLRIVSTILLKNLWASAHAESKVKIFKILMSKFSSLHSYGIIAEQFMAVIIQILNERATNNTNTDSDINTADIFIYIFQSLRKANDRILSHQNYELYSNIYSWETPKQAIKGANDYKSISNSGFELSGPNLFSSQLNTFKDSPIKHESISRNLQIMVFEKEPCMKCSERATDNYSLQAISDIKVDMKSNEQSQVFKLPTPMQIREIVLNTYDIRGVKRVDQVSIYTNSNSNAELSAIRRERSAWTFIMTMKVLEGKGGKLKFPIPITACNLMIEFHIVYSNKPSTSTDNKGKGSYANAYKDYEYESFNYGGYSNKVQTYSTFSVNHKEVLNCPRCNTVVEDSRGVCNNCRENAFQCTLCRNINYEDLEAFLCNECGCSRYGKYEFLLLARPCFAIESLKNEKMKTDAEISLENHLTNAQDKYIKLQRVKQSILDCLYKSRNIDDSNQYSEIQNLLNKASGLNKELLQSHENAHILRKELLEYKKSKEYIHDEFDLDSQQFKTDIDMDTNQPSNIEEIGEVSDCFGCSLSFLRLLLNFINETALIKEFSLQYLNDEFIEELYNNNIKEFSVSQRYLAKLVLCKIVCTNKNTFVKLLKIIEDSILSQTKVGFGSVHHYMLSSVIYENMNILTLLSRKLEDIISSNQASDETFECYSELLQSIIRILKYSLGLCDRVSTIANELTAHCLQIILDIVNHNKSASKDSNFLQVNSTNQKTISIGQLAKSDLGTYENLPILIKCLQIKTSDKCREISVKILLSLVSISNNNYFKIIDNLRIDLKSKICEDFSQEFLEILTELLSKKKIDEIAKNKENENLYISILSDLFDQIHKGCIALEHILKKQRLHPDSFYVGLNQGKSLSSIIDIVTNMIQVDFIKAEFKRGTYTYATIRSLLSIQKYSYLKLKHLSADKINKIFEEMNSDCDDDKAKLILACMWIIEESDKQSAAFLYKHIKQIIDPVRPIPNYQINMNKNPNHEIYLRGKISKNPYWTKDIGSTMKDVLDKICLTHEMSHATDLIEMLVANNIVSPDIPIHLVYEKVWYPYIYKLRNPDQYEVPKISTVDQSYKTPMDVIYRLVGVDGEASENRVEQLQDENDLVKDPEKKYALARTLSQRLPNGHSGLGILFEDLSKNSKRQEDTHLLSCLLPVLNLALKIKDNIKEIIQINGADVLVDKLYTLMSLEANEEEQLLIDQVIAILEQIVIAKSSFASFDMEVDNDKRSTGKENIKNVTMILDKIINCSEQMLEAGKSVFSTPESIVAISRILPFLAKTKEAEQKIAEVFSPHISNIHYLERDSCANREDKFKVEFYLERFFNCMESANNFIKDTFTEYGIAQQLCTYLSQTLNDDCISNEDWLLKNEKQLSLVLKSLALYCKSNAKAQEVIYQNQNGDLLKLLFKMSQARTNERKLSILAEGIIEVLANEKDVKCSQAYEFVKGLVDKARLAKRQKAKKSKAALSKTIKASDLIKKNVSLARIQKEQIACIVCQEGYQSNDKDLIGVYVFVKKVTMCPDKIVSHVEEFGYTTVTHFNTIHLKCHRNAYSADCNRKKPLSEWEGAQIRNSHAKCNALLPLKGCSISEDQFKQSISDYYSGLNYSIYNVSLNRSRVIMNDLKNVLRKFAFEESFSKDSNGGEGEHNINLIPLMLHMELIMIKDDSNWSLEKQQKDCERFISEYDFEQNQDLIDNSNEEVKGYEVEEDAKFENIDEAGDPDFEVLAKSASDKLESWMYQTLASSVFSSQKTWDEQKINLFKIGKHLAKANSKYLPVSDQIFILSEELKENQLEMTSKSSLNRYSNSIKKVILYLAMVSIIRQRFISVEGLKETLAMLNSSNEEKFEICQEIYNTNYKPMCAKTGDKILEEIFTPIERENNSLTIQDYIC